MRKSKLKPKCSRVIIVIISIMISGCCNYYNNNNYYINNESRGELSLVRRRHHGNDRNSGNDRVSSSFYVNGFIIVQNRYHSFVVTYNNNNNNNNNNHNNQKIIQTINNNSPFYRTTSTTDKNNNVPVLCIDNKNSNRNYFFQIRNKIIVLYSINSKSYNDDNSNSKILRQQRQQQQIEQRQVQVQVQQQRHTNNDVVVDNNSSDNNIENNNDSNNNNNIENNNNNNNTLTVRLNKVFKDKYSRRKADELIYSGRVSINGQCILSNDIGRQVIPYIDTISIDNIPFIGWEQRLGYNIYTTTSTSTTGATKESNIQVPTVSASSISAETNSRTTIQQNKVSQQITIQKSMLLDDTQDVYIKYWKPIGVTCTTDQSIRGNLLDSLVQYGRYVNTNNNDDSDNKRKQSNIRTVLNSHRLFSVGRLDKDTSGLLLLTSDGRVPNSVLSKQYNHSKTYYVQVNKPLLQSHIQQLQNGIVITTDRVTSNSITTKSTCNRNRHQSITCTTLPCTIQRVPDSRNNNEVYITIIEGRNRQIRIMFQTIGQYIVQQLHRIQFCNILLYENKVNVNVNDNDNDNNLQQPGDWTYLSKNEIHILQNAYNQSIIK